MKPDKKAELEQALYETGLPPQVVTEALRHGVSEWLHTLTLWLYFFCFLGGCAALYLFADTFEGMNEHNAMVAAKKVEALLYDSGDGLSLVVVLITWIFTVAVLTGLLPCLSRRFLNSVFVFSVLSKHGSRTVRLFRDRLAARFATSEPAHYIRSWVLGWIPPIALICVVLFAISVWGVPRELQTHSLYTTDAYIRSPFLPWASIQRREWLSAVSVETACNHTKKEGRIANTLLYEVHFPDGASVRLGGAAPLQGTWPEAMEAIDRKLKASGARFANLQVLQRDPLHPRCLAAMKTLYNPEDYQRVKRLLRIAG